MWDYLAIVGIITHVGIIVGLAAVGVMAFLAKAMAS